MRPALALCSACLLLLTACGGGTVTQPTPTKEKVPAPAETQPPFFSLSLASQITPPENCPFSLSELPTQLADSSAELWSGNPSYLLAQLPEEDISLYGQYSQDENSGIVLRKGDTLAAYDLPWLTPRSLLPQLYSGDFDGDGTRELLLLTYTGSGTGVSSWTLSVFEPEENGWNCLTLPDTGYYDLSPSLTISQGTEARQAVIGLGPASVTISLPDYVDPELPLEPYVGTIVEYEVTDDSIAVYLYVGLCSEEIPHTTLYVAELRSQLLYDGRGFSLVSPTLSVLED